MKKKKQNAGSSKKVDQRVAAPPLRAKFLVSVPFTGLGLYGGFRGNRWLRNRIKVFEQFVVPSLLSQTDRDFTLWIAWRREEKDNWFVQRLLERLQKQFKVVFTYSGVPFWDDKYSDEEALDRLHWTLKEALPELMEAMNDCEEVYWLLQPSDDLYHRRTIESIKLAFGQRQDIQAITFQRGYICNYNTKEVLEYNPRTNPPFFAIRFPRTVFFDPGKHVNYTGPYKSHEYVGQKLRLAGIEERGFLVGTHGENISTHFNHPYGGAKVDPSVLADFGIADVPPLVLPVSTRKWIMRRLPYKAQRKLRYLFGERFYAKLYSWLRS